MTLSLLVSPDPTILYTSERSFTAAKWPEATWLNLFPSDPESYRYHLALEISAIPGVRMGYVAVKRGGVVVCLAPYFIAGERFLPGSQDQSISAPIAGMDTQQVLYIGSPATSTAKIGINRDYLFDADMLHELYAHLQQIAERANVSRIVFKGIVEADAAMLASAFQRYGFVDQPAACRPVITINAPSMDAYIRAHDASQQPWMNQALRLADSLQIRQSKHLPSDQASLDALHQLISHSHGQDSHMPPGNAVEASPEVAMRLFENIAGLMPEQCQFIEYRAPADDALFPNLLLGFSMFIFVNGVAVEKCCAMRREMDARYQLRHVLRMQAIKIAISEGVHTYKPCNLPDKLLATTGMQFESTYTYILDEYTVEAYQVAL